MAPKGKGGGGGGNRGSGNGGSSYHSVGSVTLHRHWANLAVLVITGIALVAMLPLLFAMLKVKTKKKDYNLNMLGFKALKCAIALATLYFALILTDEILHQLELTLSRYYFIVLAFWYLSKTGAEVSLIATLHLILDKHPSASLEGKARLVPWIAGSVFLTIVGVLGVVIVGMGIATTIPTVDPSRASASTISVTKSLSDVIAAYSILYLILNIGLTVLAWKAFNREKSHMKSKPKAMLFTGIASSVLLVRSFISFIFNCIYNLGHVTPSKGSFLVDRLVISFLTPTVCLFLVLVAFQPEWTSTATDQRKSVEGPIEYIIESPPTNVNNPSPQPQVTYSNIPAPSMGPMGNSYTQHNYTTSGQLPISPVNNPYTEPNAYGNQGRYPIPPSYETWRQSNSPYPR